MWAAAHRIAHVVQGVEDRHQVIAAARIGAGGGDLEAAALGHPRVGPTGWACWIEGWWGSGVSSGAAVRPGAGLLQLGGHPQQQVLAAVGGDQLHPDR
jgi:hypothetical protein